MIVQTWKVFHGFLTICHFIYYRFFYNIISKFKREKFYHHHIIIFKLVHDDSFNGSFWIFLNLLFCFHFIIIYFWIDVMKNIQSIFSTYIKLLSWITSMSILSKMPYLDSPWHDLVSCYWVLKIGIAVFSFEPLMYYIIFIHQPPEVYIQSLLNFLSVLQVPTYLLV